MVERAEAIRSLAASLRAGMTFREALIAWDVPAPEMGRVSRRLRLGLPIPGSLEVARSFFGGDLDALLLVTELQGRTGGDAAAMLEAVARSIDERAAATGRAEVNAAGARLSARIVAGLPLAALVFLPGSPAPLLDPVGLVILLSGVALCLGGMLWIGKLLPTPPDRVDDVALLAVIIAAALRSGSSVNQVLDAAARCSTRVEMESARRRRALGLAWPDALSSQSDGLGCLGHALAASRRTGAPVAGALDAFAERRSQSLDRDLEREIKRAPVKMVVPLTLCVLPSFALLGVTPFLRSLAPA
jgi:tight adherence protein B